MWFAAMQLQGHPSNTHHMCYANTYVYAQAIKIYIVFFLKTAHGRFFSILSPEWAVFRTWAFFSIAKRKNKILVLILLNNLKSLAK
jgi:hypothetical protein